jgi:hypothetical protein
MCRTYFYLAAFISILTASLPALAETAAAPVPAGTHEPTWATTANDGGFYVDLPAVSPDKLMTLIRAYRTFLTRREAEIAKYLDENQLDAKDTLITIIMPGGLLYAAIRTGNLEQAKAELAEVTEDMEELSSDLLAMQAVAGELTVAQLQ